MQPIGRATKPLMRDLFRREEARLALMRASWRELVGETLARRVVPASFDGETLRLRPDDVRWEKAALAVATELAAKIRREIPEARVSTVEILPAVPPSAQRRGRPVRPRS